MALEVEGRQGQGLVVEAAGTLDDLAGVLARNGSPFQGSVGLSRASSAPSRSPASSSAISRALTTPPSWAPGTRGRTLAV